MYIDPNTGGVLFQALVSLFAVFTGAILVFSSRIRAGIAKLRRRNKDKEENKEE